MSRPCTVCLHPQRLDIDKALIRSEPKRRIAVRFELSGSSVRRHAIGHLPDVLPAPAPAALIAEPDTLPLDLAAEFRAVFRDAQELGRQAKGGSVRDQAVALTVRLKVLDLVASRPTEETKESLLHTVRQAILTLPAEMQSAVAEALDQIDDAPRVGPSVVMSAGWMERAAAVVIGPWEPLQ